MTRCLLRRSLAAGAAAVLLPTMAVAADAGPKPFPDVIDLPDGFQPEGITIGAGPTAYAGSLADGDIVEVDLRSGDVERIVDRPADAEEDVRDVAVGLDTTNNGRVLFAAGGPTGEVNVYDTRTGATLATVDLIDPGTGFINDVVITQDAAFLTNSSAAELYRVALDQQGVPTGDVETLPLEGDFELEDGFNANGIDATSNGDTLVIVQSNTGKLFTVDPATGLAAKIDLDGETVTNGDGIALQGRSLDVVQNRDNLVTTIELAPDLASGEIVEQRTDGDFDVPTTIDRFGSRDYVVNARFGTTPTPDTAYTLVRVGS